MAYEPKPGDFSLFINEGTAAGEDEMMQGNFEAKKHSYRQTQDGVVVSFVIHPSDVSPEFAAAPLGTVFVVAYAEPQEEPEAPTAPAQTRHDPFGEPSNKTEGERAVVRAALLCKGLAFQEWFYGKHMDYWNEAIGALHACATITPDMTCAEAVRRFCGVLSRAELATNAKALKTFLGLEDSYLRATGRRTERHER